MQKSLTLYKLMILYLLSRVKFPLTNSQLSNFILESGYTTFFKLQEAISELLNTQLISPHKEQGRTFYRLTDTGTETIQFFSGRIPLPIRQDMEQWLNNNYDDLKNDASIKADYYRNANHEYNVRCQVIEQQLPVIDLTVTVPSEEQAQTLATNWKQYNEDIYAYIMSKLL